LRQFHCRELNSLSTRRASHHEIMNVSLGISQGVRAFRRPHGSSIYKRCPMGREGPRICIRFPHACGSTITRRRP
jgi:hypothetical protein